MRSGKWTFEAVPCLCGCTRLRVITIQDRFSLPAPISCCRSCGLLQTNPRMTASAYSDFYSRYYRNIYMAWTPQLLFENQQTRGMVLRNWLKQKAGIQFGKGSRVFEIGTGAGGILSVFAKNGCDVTGCDFDPLFLEYGREQGLKLLEGGSSTLIGHEPADLVVLCHVLEHLPSPIKELQAICRLLKPNGLVYVQVPGVDYELMHYHPNGHYLFDFLDYAQNAHIYHFDLPELLHIAQEAGVEPIAYDKQVTALFRLAREKSLTDSEEGADKKGDESLRQLKRLRAMELRRKYSRWVEEPLRAAIPVSYRLLYSFSRNAAKKLRIKDAIKDILSKT